MCETEVQEDTMSYVIAAIVFAVCSALGVGLGIGLEQL
jgi:hypothetical protein